jgi:hypothetical protein
MMSHGDTNGLMQSSDMQALFILHGRGIFRFDEATTIIMNSLYLSLFDMDGSHETVIGSLFLP